MDQKYFIAIIIPIITSSREDKTEKHKEEEEHSKIIL